MRHAAALLAFLLVLTGCSGPSVATGGAFRPDPPPVWTTDGIRIANFNGEFLFDGMDDEGEATFPWKGDTTLAREHRARIGAVVRMLDADLVIMPESENLRALQMMVDEVLPDFGYTPHLVDGRDTFTGQDVGLLSRIPVDTTGRTDELLPVGVSDQTYGVSKNLWARMTLGGTPVTVIGVHFLAQPDNVERKDRRDTQAEVIRRLVEREIALGREVIVMGDFNDFDDQVADIRGSVPITDVLKTIKSAGPGAADDLVNVLGDIPQSQRFTAVYDRNADGVLVTDDLSAIDHILLSPALYRRVREVRFVHAHDPISVSDHFPIVVTLE